jgi:hypothetical protein
VFVKPGVVFDPDNPSAHWGFIVVLRGDEPAYRANLTFQDIDKADEIGRQLKAGKSLSHDEIFSDFHRNQYEELDPHPARKGRDTEVDMFHWRPPNMSNEKYLISVEHRTGGTSEDLRIKAVDGGWQVAMKVADEKSGDVLILCKDPKFPSSSEWASDLPKCFPEYRDRYRDLGRYESFIFKMLGLQQF